MKIKRRTKITSETERAFSIAVSRKTIRFFCPSCGGQAEMLTINEAAKRLKKLWREIVRLIENGEIHSIETANGEIYVCADSLGIFAVND